MKANTLGCIATSLILASGSTMLFCGCRSQSASSSSVSQSSGSPAQSEGAVTLPVNDLSSKPAAVVLKATAFKMNGNYADKVAVTLDAQGKLVYYPSPTDLTPNSAPVEIGDGWWLNRQGISPNSVFTRWSFKEYAAMEKAPTPAEIKEAIIPGSGVSEFRQLPITASQAIREAPASLLKYLK